MIKKIVGLLLVVLGLVVVLAVNGTILKDKLNLPSLGKVLNPFHGFWAPQDADRKIALEGKSGPVEILIDKRGVPHIYAQTMDDALYGQGYIEARDRTFQMQFLRQAATGQLSEYFGDRTVSYDKWTHKKGMPSTIKATAKRWRKDDRVSKTLQHYVDGANTYLSSLPKSKYPFEMKLLDLSPKLWDFESGVAVFKYMGNVLAGGNDAIENTNVRILLGEEKYAKYFREDEDLDEPVIPEEVIYDFDNLANAGEAADKLFDRPIYNAYFEKRNKAVGSNNWAISSSKSATGYPILCSDPHLSLSIPSIWYELNIITPDTDVYGVSFPGLPGIMIGFNQDIAWGETNVGHDVQDLYHINYTDDSRSHYWLDDKKVPVELRIDSIRLKSGTVVTDTNYITTWGPIIKRSHDGKTDIAMNWLVSRPAPSGEALTFVDAMSSKNYDEFLEATNQFMTPAQNFLYADRHKEIGLRVNGLLPARVDQDGRFVSEGDKSSYGWNSFIPRDQNPQARNPQQGYLTSANQRSASDDYPYYYVGGFERYRNRAINDHLDTISSITIEDMKTYQTNNYSKKAEDMVPLMLKAVAGRSLTPSAQKVVDAVSGWNYEYNVDTKAPSLFEKWYNTMRNLTWDEIAEYRDTMAVAYPISTVLRDLIKNEPNDPMFDKLHTNEQESAADIIFLALEETAAYLDEKDAEALKWGNENNVNIPHVARVPGLGADKLFAPGCGDVVNATRGSFGPSWRMVVSLEDKVNAYGIYPGGQSGDPRSKHYMDRVEKWRLGQHDRLIFGVEKSKIVEDE